MRYYIYDAIRRNPENGWKMTWKHTSRAILSHKLPRWKRFIIAIHSRGAQWAFKENWEKRVAISSRSKTGWEWRRINKLNFSYLNSFLSYERQSKKIFTFENWNWVLKLYTYEFIWSTIREKTNKPSGTVKFTSPFSFIGYLLESNLKLAILEFSNSSVNTLSVELNFL